MEVAVGELTLAGLDRAQVDAVAIFVGQTERPLRRLAGLCDWRLCGALSRVLRTGFYAGNRGEILLLPTMGRLLANKILAFGLGTGVLDNPHAFLTKVFETLDRAGVRTVALSLDELELPLETSLKLWHAQLTRSRVEHQLLLGEPRSLYKALATELQGDPRVQLEAWTSAEPEEKPRVGPQSRFQMRAKVSQQR